MFNTKRGRPKKNYSGKDYGTKELQIKRKYNITAEPLDVIFSRNLIDEIEYEAGCRLRWLYSLKFGIAHTTAYNPENIAGKEIKKIDLDWLSKRNKELSDAINLLRDEKSYYIISHICIFLKIPGFLINKNFSQDICGDELQKFKDGLTKLSIFFMKKNSYSRPDVYK